MSGGCVSDERGIVRPNILAAFTVVPAHAHVVPACAYQVGGAFIELPDCKSKAHETYADSGADYVDLTEHSQWNHLTFSLLAKTTQHNLPLTSMIQTGRKSPQTLING